MTAELEAPTGVASDDRTDVSDVLPFDLVPEALRPALAAKGFAELTPVQRAVLEAGSADRDFRISSQTGSGKTVALGFAIAPRLEGDGPAMGPRALIIVPTRELANQVCGELAWLLAGLEGVEVASVTGGTPLYRDRALLRDRPRVLVGTPGRLLDHVRSGQLLLDDVAELVLDEADQMLDMGFREELEGILDATPTTRRTHLVSATFPEGIQQLAERYQREPLVLEGTRLGDAHADIDHEGHLVRQHDRYAVLVNLLLLAEGERTLVFVERRADAVEVAERLEADGFAALPLSGELAQSQRERTIAAFRDGRVSILVATDVAARGLDVPEVSIVVQTSPPIDAEVYVHRSGRTGRAGRRGRCVLLSPPSRRRRVDRLLDEAGVELSWKPVPGKAEIERVLSERRRETMRTELDAALEAGPAEELVEQARELLEDRDAAPLVAALLARIAPDRKARPRDVEGPRERREYDRVDRGERGDRGDRGRAPYGDRSRPGRERGRRGDARQERHAGRAPGRTFDAVRFFMNCGANQGATPSRVLASVCRRGEVNGSDIGSIAIHPNATTFDVRTEVADKFEHLAGRRDTREPKTLIRRDRGPRAPGGGGGSYRPRRRERV